MSLVVALTGIDRTHVDVAGGKAANLGELLQAGVPVPDGCCVTTEAFRLALAEIPGDHLDRLAALAPG